MNAGATGLVFARNVWQRPREAALQLNGEMRRLLVQHSV